MEQDLENKNKIWIEFLFITSIKVLIIECFFGLFLQFFIFNIKLEGLNPTLGIISNNNLTLPSIFFSMLFFPCFGAEITLRIGEHSFFDNQKVFGEGPFVGLFILLDGLIVLTPIEILYIISSVKLYFFKLANDSIALFHIITGILIKTIALVVIMNVAPGIIIWILYPYFVKFYRKAFRFTKI